MGQLVTEDGEDARVTLDLDFDALDPERRARLKKPLELKRSEGRWYFFDEEAFGSGETEAKDRSSRR